MQVVHGAVDEHDRPRRNLQIIEKNAPERGLGESGQSLQPLPPFSAEAAPHPTAHGGRNEGFDCLSKDHGRGPRKSFQDDGRMMENQRARMTDADGRALAERGSLFKTQDSRSWTPKT